MQRTIENHRPGDARRADYLPEVRAHLERRQEPLKGAAIITTPQVPRYEPTEKTAALRTPRAQGVGPDAFGGGLARGANQASGNYLAVLKQEKEKADRVSAIESRTQLDQLEVDLLYDPNQGALITRGKDAFGLPEPVLQKYSERTAEIERKLATPEQKEAFRLLAQQRRVEVDKQLQRHVSGEMKTYAQEAVKSSLESTLNNIATHYNDPQRIEQERKFGLAVLMTDADNAGLPPEAVKLKAQTWESMVHKAVIEKIAVDSPLKAKDYLEANRENLLPAEVTKLETTLKPLAEAQQGMEAAGEIFYSADETEPLAEMLRNVRERFPDSPSVVKAATAEIKGLYTAREEAKTQAIAEAEGDVYAAIAKVKLAGGVPRKGDVPQAAWNRLAQVAPEKVDSILSSMTTEQSSQPSSDQLTTWGLLKTDPETLTQTNLDALLVEGKISRGHYTDLITDQLAIRNGKGEKETTILTNKAAVDTVLKAVGITQSKNPERYAKFYEAMNQRMKAFEVENGKVPKQGEITEMARGLLGEVSQDVSFWPIDKDVRAFEADPSRLRVPAKDQAAITAKLEARGIPATDETVREVYLEAQKRGGS
ncbi:MAG: hypothetical protein RQ754_02830 [Desulfuromonadales bacterium]|nr:hypothetical protein [Desulfuromonadales bacterium]